MYGAFVIGRNQISSFFSGRKFKLMYLWLDDSCLENFAGVMVIEMFVLKRLCLNEISSKQGHMIYKHA